MCAFVSELVQVALGWLEHKHVTLMGQQKSLIPWKGQGIPTVIS